MYSDDENCPDIFDRLAESKYSDQADIDTVFPSTQNKKLNSSTKQDTKFLIRLNDRDSDEDLSDIEDQLEVTEIKRKEEELQKLKSEHSRWEKVRHQAQQNKIDSKRIAKVSQKISEILFKIQDLETYIEKHGKNYKQKREILQMELEIKHLEVERSNIVMKLDIITEKLGKLRPYNEKQDYTNDPKNAEIDAEDDYAILAKLISERRNSAIETNEYNGDPKVISKGVRIINPKY